MPATPIATSVVPCRKGRPKESLTITGTPSLSWSARAEASGSSGSRTTVPGAGALEASTPAEAQTKPWRVSAMISGGLCDVVLVASGDNLKSADGRDNAVHTLAMNFEREFEERVCVVTGAVPRARSVDAPCRRSGVGPPAPQ